MPTATLPDLPHLLSTDQTAELLGVSVNTLEVWRCVKRHPSLRYCKIGSRVKYRKADVLAWIDKRTVGDDPAAD